MIWPGRQANELMHSPKSRKHQRVIDCSPAGPNFLQSQRTNDAGVSSQMRFIVPNEAGIKDLGVGHKNESD